MSARKVKLTIEYDGSGFSGWQVQPGVRTVQGDLEAAFSALAGLDVRVHGAGRTDAGVHALGQVAHVETDLTLPTEKLQTALNARLNEDVLIVSAEDVGADFNARFDAVSRSYLYLMGFRESPIWRGRRWFVKGALDRDAMEAALEPFDGVIDCSSFCLTGSEPKHHRCRIDAISLEWFSEHGGMLVLRIEADRFLRGMVRSIVGTLVEVGRGRISAGSVPEIIDARDRGRGGPTVPPWGLYLERIEYGGEAQSEDISGHGEH
jgi:tRNA pseudouridine38-40 synthase